VSKMDKNVNVNVNESDGPRHRPDPRVEELTRSLGEIRALCLAILPERLTERLNARETVDLVRDVVGSLHAWQVTINKIRRRYQPAREVLP
jgi:hypothetical protein